MHEDLNNMEFYIEMVAKTIEAIGIVVIFIGLLYSLSVYVKELIKRKKNCYGTLRKSLGKFILLGLEILIAADIVATVVTTPSLRSVTILGIIVLIRTFLSLSIQVEIEGKFPWQKTSNNQLHD